MSDFISSWIAKLHNVWLNLPAWVREAGVYAVAALIVLGQKFTWHFPASLQDAWAELGAFAILAVPVLIAAFRVKVAPYLVEWFLKNFNYGPVGFLVAPVGMTAGEALKVSARWIKNPTGNGPAPIPTS